jgi:hypothetical protein
VSFLIITGLLLSFLVYSPLVRAYEEWRDSGNISKMFLQELSKIISDLPDDAIIHIYNFPKGISSYETKIPHAKEVSYCASYAIKSWINLNYPSNRIRKVIIHNKIKLANYPSALYVRVKDKQDKDVSVVIEYSGTDIYPAY